MRSAPLLGVLLACLTSAPAAAALEVKPVDSERAPATLSPQDASAARPAVARASRGEKLVKRVQRLRRDKARAKAASPSQARSVQLKRVKAKLVGAERELSEFRAAKASASTSAGGVKFIAGFEGFFSRPYNDPVGYCTIGYGHLIAYRGCNGQDRAKWGSLSQGEAQRLLRGDLRGFERCINDNVSVRLTQGQYDALVSFTYNLGCGAFQGSTLRQRLQARAYCSAGNEFLRWDRAGGQQLAGLTRRRKAERVTFLRGVRC